MYSRGVQPFGGDLVKRNVEGRQLSAQAESNGSGASALHARTRTYQSDIMSKVRTPTTITRSTLRHSRLSCDTRYQAPATSSSSTTMAPTQKKIL